MIQLLLFSENTTTNTRLKNILKAEGIDTNISDSSSPEKTLQTLSRTKFDMVVLETANQSINYLKLLQKIKMLHPSVPVLMLSMDNTRTFALQAMRLNAHGFLTKDSMGLELADAVKSIRLGRCYMTTALTA
ncbi:MAG: response regulator transcription factor [Deltaproteobacteria bacterium]|nr:response regulator transcription factor [Deltaproteobacteria bacterium]